MLSTQEALGKTAPLGASWRPRPDDAGNNRPGCTLSRPMQDFLGATLGHLRDERKAIYQAGVPTAAGSLWRSLGIWGRSLQNPDRCRSPSSAHHRGAKTTDRGVVP